MNKQEIETKVEQLLSQLTLEEKLGMIHGNGLFQTKGVERLQVPPVKMSDGPMGVRNEFENAQWIPVGNSDDYVSYLPSNSALTATWNTELAYETGRVLGAEARGRGKDIILAPGINIKRSPLCGRNFEYMSEDPYLIQKMAVPLIKGVQESDVAACVKHFAANNQETERLWVDVEVSDRALYELYFPGFYAAVKEGDSYSLMGAYNLIRGEHSCQSNYLLNDVLRDQWEYEGCVVSDWGGVHDTKRAAISGLDIEMSVTSNFDEYMMANPLLEAVKSGEIAEELVDRKVRNILRMMYKTKMIGEGRKSGTYNTPTHREKILKASRESIVLLKNDENRLPLKKENLKKLLVIGDNAERIHSNGGGSAEIKALYEISPLMGLKTHLGGNTEVVYTRGYYVPTKEEKEINWQESSLEPSGTEMNIEADINGDMINNPDSTLCYKKKTLMDEAVALAKESDDVILFCGLNHDYDVEGLDREDMKLPYYQDELIKEVLKVSPNAIIVMVAGSPVEMGEWINDAKAVVWGWYGGMEGGNALAEVLLGETNPSGKLPESFPKNAMDCSAHCIGEFPGDKTVAYREGIYVGYRYYDIKQIEPEFCFGYGLSYTDFTIDNLNIESIETNDDVQVTVTCDITNIGKIAGKEVVQLYVADKECTVDRPVRELKAFAKQALKPGEKKRVKLMLDKTSFSFYNEAKQVFEAEAGNFFIQVGNSSRNLPLIEEIKLKNNYIWKY